jgi:hypothetical protein
MHAMSSSATTDVSWIRAQGRAGGRSGRTSATAGLRCPACDTIPDLRRSEHEAKLAVRRKPSARERGLHCAAPHCGRQCGMRAHGLLPSDCSDRLRARRRAGHAAGVSAYAEEHGLDMPSRASARVACVTMPARMREERGDAAAAPAPPPRRTCRACCIVVRVCEACPCTDRVCGPSARLVAGMALPVTVRDALIGAADEQLRGDVDAADDRRNVQRRPPAGRGGHGCHRRHRRPPPTTRRTAPAAKAHPL